MVGHGVDAADAPAYAAHNDLGTAVLLAAMYAGGRHPARAGRVDGRLRGGPLHLRRARRRPARAARGRRRRRRTVRAALPASVAATSNPAWCPRTRRSTRAARTPPPSSPRSTCRGVGAPDRGSGVVVALPQRVRPTDAARHPLLRGGVGVPVGAGARRAAARDGGRQAAPGLRARRATSPRPTSSPSATPRPGCTPVNVCSGEPHTVGEMAAELAQRDAGPGAGRSSAARGPGTCGTWSPTPPAPRRCWGSPRGRASPTGMGAFATDPLRAPVATEP